LGTLVKVKAPAARRAIDDTIWDTANGILYGLCRKYPGHTDDAIIVAKLWLIGRSYAAAIERGAHNLKRNSLLKVCGIIWWNPWEWK